MQEVVIIDALRTPIGRIRGGLSALRPDDMLAATFKAVVERAKRTGQYDIVLQKATEIATTEANELRFRRGDPYHTPTTLLRKIRLNKQGGCPQVALARAPCFRDCGEMR